MYNLRWLTLALVVWISATIVHSDLSFEQFGSAWAKRDSCFSGDLATQCSTNATKCVESMCSSCQSVVQIVECCRLASLSDKLECCVNALNYPLTYITTTQGSNTSTRAPTSTALTNQTKIPATAGTDACDKVYSLRQSCQNRTSTFAAMPFTQQATCLCSQAKKFNATIYDGPWSTCLAYASTAKPALYDLLVSANWGGQERAPCSSVGSMATTIPTKTTTSSSTTSNVWYIGYTTIPEAAGAGPSQSHPTLAVSVTTTSGIGRTNPDFAIIGLASAFCWFLWRLDL